jgi:hypothetical protein
MRGVFGANGLCKGNFRFLGIEADDKYWLNEPACYLTDEEITGGREQFFATKAPSHKGSVDKI